MNGINGSPLMITEYSSDPDFIEITNVTNQPFDATGWQVLMNDNSSNINVAGSQPWALGQFQSNEVKQGDEAVEFGSVVWLANDNIWVMLVDDQGNVMDFVASNWTASDIQGMNVTSGGFSGLNPGSEWTGDGVTSSGDFIIRQVYDNDNASDWTSAASGSAGTYNPGLSMAPGFSINACKSPRDSVNVNVIFPQNNAGISNIMTNSGCKMTVAEPVTIEIVNSGANAITSGLTATYQVDNNPFITPEQVNVTIPSKDTITYTFNTTADLSAGANDTNYVITAAVNLTGDTYSPNDTLVSGNIPSLYTPNSPVLTNPTITFGNNTTLNYSSTDSLFWYVNDSIQNEFYIGNSYTTPVLYDTTTYYVEQTEFSPFSAQVGTGTQTTNYIPAYGLWDYGWSNTIYLNNELGSAGMIDTIAFYVDNSVTNYSMPDQIVYMANSSQQSLTTSKPDPANMQEVFNGPVTWNGPGWVSIPLDSSFFYNGSDNLRIYWENRDGDWDSGYPDFRASSVSGNYAVYEYADNTFPMNAGMQTSERPNIKISGSDKGCGSQRVPWTVNVIGHPPVDGQLLAIEEPATGQLKNNDEPVSFRVKNNGTDTLTSLEVGYEFDGQSPVIEALNVNMFPGDTLVHTFNSTVDMSQFRSYPMVGFVHVNNDTVTVNDTIFKSLENKLDYCESRATSSFDDTYLSYMELNGVKNPSGGPNANYTDFTSSVTAPVVYPSVAHDISLAMDAGTLNNTIVKVFIDANRNGTFEMATETMLTDTFNTAMGDSLTSSITLPANAQTGYTMMRIVLQETSTASDVNPCGYYDYGETEDYLVRVTPLIPKDAGIIAIPKPNNFLINQNQQFEVKVKNFGQDTLQSVDITHSINGTAGSTFTFTGTMAPQDTATVSLPNLSIPYGNQDICASTVLNGDSNTFNDGYCKSVYREYVTNPPYTDDLEGPSYFRTDTAASVTTQWELGKPMANNITSAYSGQNAWMVDLDANYDNNANYKLYTPKLAIQSQGVDSLVFWHYYDTEQGMDGGYVEYRNTSGQWSSLEDTAVVSSAVNWYNDSLSVQRPGFSGNSGGWIRSSICIDSAHAPNMSSITQFRFVFYSDGSNNSGDGWAIDDVWVKVPKSNIDAGATAIVNPLDTTTTGTQVNVEMEIKNFGLDTLNSIPVSYNVNGSVQSETWTGTLYPDAKTTYTFNNAYTSPNADYEIIAYTDLSNDGNRFNDTTKTNIIALQPPIDAGISAIIKPEDTTTQFAQTTVKVRITNYGTDALTSIPVEYDVNGANAASETWTGNLPSGDSVEYTFNGTFQAPAGGFELCVKTALGIDYDDSNNELCKDFITSAIEDNSAFSDVRIQPNPADQYFIIDFNQSFSGNIRISISDIAGHTMYENEYDLQGDSRVNISTVKLPAGLYFIMMENKDGRALRKVIINH